MNQAKENRPGANGADSEIINGYNPSLTPSHAGLLAGVYVAVIQIRGTGINGKPPRYRRRVHFNLPSANRAVDRATAEGLDASVILCRLMPISGGLDD